MPKSKITCCLLCALLILSAFHHSGCGNADRSFCPTGQDSPAGVIFGDMQAALDDHPLPWEMTLSAHHYIKEQWIIWPIIKARIDYANVTLEIKDFDENPVDSANASGEITRLSDNKTMIALVARQTNSDGIVKWDIPLLRYQPEGWPAGTYKAEVTTVEGEKHDTFRLFDEIVGKKKPETK